MGKYDPKKVMKELLGTVSEIYHDTGELTPQSIRGYTVVCLSHVL